MNSLPAAAGIAPPPAAPRRTAFGWALLVWGVRVGVSAAPSFVWASTAEFRAPHATAGMLAGVASWTLFCAWGTTRAIFQHRIEPTGFGWMLRVGANIRAGLTPLWAFWPDIWLGLVSLYVTKRIAIGAGYGDIDPQNTFVATYVTTLVQGGLVALTIVPLGLAAWLLRAGWRTIGRR